MPGTGLTSRGFWDHEANYDLNDLVTYQGSAWLSLHSNNINNIPQENVWWTLFSLGGDSGYSGISGYSGATVTSHAALSNLGYINSGHSGFQKELIWETAYQTYLIEHI